jgi:hypothetical protein
MHDPHPMPPHEQVLDQLVALLRDQLPQEATAQ